MNRLAHGIHCRNILITIVCLSGASLACRDGSPPAARATTISTASDSEVETRVPLSGDGSWDHVIASSAMRQLYVAHASHIDVLHLDGDTLVGVLDSLPDVHGVALDHGAHRGYTSNGGDSSVTVFDMRSLRALRRIHLTSDAPDGIVFDPASHRVFAMHEKTPALSVIEAGPDTVRSSVALGGTPDGGVPDGHGRLYVALKDRSELVALDTHTLTVEQRWPLAPCMAPDAIAMDTLRHRVYLGCGNGTTVSVETPTGVVHAGFPIGPGVDGISVSGETVLASTANGEVRVATCRQDRCAVTRTIRTGQGSATSALDEQTMRLFVPEHTPAPTPQDSVAPRRRNQRGGPGFGVLVLRLGVPGAR